jgi:hypothetical protein
MAVLKTVKYVDALGSSHQLELSEHELSKVQLVFQVSVTPAFPVVLNPLNFFVPFFFLASLLGFFFLASSSWLLLLLIHFVIYSFSASDTKQVLQKEPDCRHQSQGADEGAEMG